jgi:sugar O-acyltransferase (sialic acid O-acetyltransferase NeuD family)
VSRVVIFGTGDFAQVASVYLQEDSEHEVIAFTVDEAHLAERELLGLPVVPFEQLEATYPPDTHAMLVAVGFSGVNEARASVYARCKERGYELVSYVSSRSTVWSGLDLGDNCFIFDENTIQPFVRVGNNVVLWSGNHIGHHSSIGNNCFLASHIVVSGNVTIGDNCFIGVNATIRDGITIGPRSVIGAGALIMRDTEEGDVYSVRRTEAGSRKSWDLEGF